MPRALLFDIGGVLLDISFDDVVEAWCRHARQPSSPQPAFPFDEAYRRYERGEIDEAAWFRHVAQVLDLDATDAQVKAGWNAIFHGELEPTLTWVEAAARVLPCYGFSNTNAAHLATWRARFPRLERALRRIFVSHELGMRKPEPAAYRQVCAAIGQSPKDVLFFDDMQANVDAARACGLAAVLVRSPGDVTRALAAIGVRA